MTSDPVDLRAAAVDFVAAQRRMVASLEDTGADVSAVAAAMTAELDRLEAVLLVPGCSQNAVRAGDPGE